MAKGAVDLGKLQDESEKKAAEEAAESFKPMLEKLKEALKDKAEDVRVTTRLVDSPACLVVQDGGMSTQLARMLKQAGQPAPELKPVLEVNAEHPLVKKLEGSAHFDDLANILFDQALLAEGGLPADPAAYVTARQRAAGVNDRPRVPRAAAVVPAALLLLLTGGCSHYHVGIPLVPGLSLGLGATKDGNFSVGLNTGFGPLGAGRGREQRRAGVGLGRRGCRRRAGGHGGQQGRCAL